jgi:hypothetical protein
MIPNAEDSEPIVSDSVQTAEAYRWATMLLLRQAIPAIPRTMTLEELAQKVLCFLATVPMDSRTIIIQTFPLLVAGSEIEDLEEREWVKQRWDAMSVRMITGIVDRCLELTFEVWRRKDEQRGDYSSAFTLGFADSIIDSGISLTSINPAALVKDLINPTPLITLPAQPSAPKRERDLGSFPLGNSFLTAGYAMSSIKERLPWLGVMRDWNWQGGCTMNIESRLCIILMTSR